MRIDIDILMRDIPGYYGMSYYIKNNNFIIETIRDLHDDEGRTKGNETIKSVLPILPYRMVETEIMKTTVNRSGEIRYCRFTEEDQKYFLEQLAEPPKMYKSPPSRD